jgi:hypothetical protein
VAGELRASSIRQINYTSGADAGLSAEISSVGLSDGGSVGFSSTEISSAEISSVALSGSKISGSKNKTLNNVDRKNDGGSELYRLSSANRRRRYVAANSAKNSATSCTERRYSAKFSANSSFGGAVDDFDIVDDFVTDLVSTR